MRLVEFLCPFHGVVAAAPAVSRVECHCGQEAAPEGLTPLQNRTRYLAARRQRRKRDKPVAKAQVRASRPTK